MDDTIQITDLQNRKARRLPEEPEKEVWWALSAPYCRELKARELLESKGVRCYVAMHWEVKELPRGGKKKLLVPVIHNLVFAFCTRSRIQEIKSGVAWLQYHCRTEQGRRIPIIVPERQMEDFMRVCGFYSSDLRYFGPGEIANLAEGTPVRIISGQFQGVEGTFLKIKGIRSRKVVVSIPFVASVVPMEVDAIDIEEIKPESSND